MQSKWAKLAVGPFFAAMILGACASNESEKEEKPVMEEPTDKVEEDEDNQGGSTEKNAENDGNPSEENKEEDPGIDKEDTKMDGQ
ncbi:hypothetical protein AC623_04915 [Bacillus sp. FJAT-27231]|uniref:hypothetical protein n=1 Tax=Bacillus sp. FJAT-27231 TaxID=1679168 RepID=UPI000670DBA6|nr:hypothetical protein [Bacillus sp. FJAT-27231]KMY53407.1 hypothetical protein AC623_04915 [Bacillus sp. FJAT-27231]